jgi:hypothetical protein
VADTSLVPQGDYDLTTVTRDSVYEAVNVIIQDLHKTGNLSRAKQALSSLETITDVSGMGRAYLLWGMQEWYKETKDEHPEPFFATINMTDPNKIVHARRLISVWDAVDKNLIPPKVLQRDIKVLIKVAGVLEDGYEIGPETWAEIAAAPNVDEVGRIIRDKIRKAPARKGTLTLRLAQNGNIYAERDGERRLIGYLDTDHEDEFALVKAGIAKITHNTPIRRTE